MNPLRPHSSRQTRPVGACVFGTLVLLVAPMARGQIVLPPPGGTTVTWTDDASNGQWSDDDNWNVHIPQDGDAVIIDDSHYNVVLQNDAATIRSLFLGGGIALYNFGHKLPVGNATNNATTTITGNGSQLIVSDIPGTGPAFDTDYLNLNNGGRLNMDGGRAQVDREIDMAGASQIRGHGLLEVGGAGDAALGFSPTSELNVHGGNLRIDMTGGGTIAFGGAEMDVTAANSDLIVEGDQFGPIADALRIGAGNSVEFQGPWEISGDLQFVSGGGQLTGGSGELSGLVNVASAVNGALAGTLDFTAAGDIDLNNNSTLALRGTVQSRAGHATSLGVFSTLQIETPDPATVVGTPTVMWRGDIDTFGSTVEANRHPGDGAGRVRLTGQFDSNGSTKLDGTAHFSLEGNTTVSNAGLTIQNDGGTQFSSTSNTVINAGSRIRVDSWARINVGAEFSGAGEFRVATNGYAYGVDGSAIGVNVFNQGELGMGLGTDYAARLTLGGDYVQLATGALDVDLTGTLPTEYDRLVVEGAATIDGELEVSLREGFEPSIGDNFLVLSADEGLTGTFASMALPALGAGRAWAVDYSPFAATLSVIGKVFTADADGNGVVDGADLLVIQRDMGKMVPTAGDITGDYRVDGLDVAKWREDFGTVIGVTAMAAAAAIGAVPEPGAAALGGMAALALAAGSRRRRSL